MEGTSYHTSIPCGPHEDLLSGLLFEINLVTVSANGVIIKLNSPNRYACADSCEFTREYYNNLRVKFYWLRSQFHYYSGKPGSQYARLALKCLLNVWMYRSARFSFEYVVVTYGIWFYPFTLLILFCWYLIVNAARIRLHSRRIEGRI